MKVSVIVLSYNSEDTIMRALDSVAAQKCGFEWEIVVGDDGSTDRTREIIENYARSHPELRFRLLFSDTNRGVQANYFDCLEAATGEYIADCAADDAWTGDGRLSSFVKELDANPDAAWAFSDWTSVDAVTGLRHLIRPALTRNVDCGEMQELLLECQSRPAMHLSACVYRKSSLMPYYARFRDDLFRNQSYCCEDFQILMTLAAAGRGLYMPVSTLDYTVGGESITSQHSALRAARFALGTLRLRLDLAARYGLMKRKSVGASLALQYHYALSQAIISGDDACMCDANNLWHRLPTRPMRTLLLRLLLALPGGKRFVRGIKNIMNRRMFIII